LREESTRIISYFSTFVQFSNSIPIDLKKIDSDATMPYYIKFNHHKQSHNLQQLTPATAKKEEELGIPPFAVVVPLLIFDGFPGLQTG